MIQNTSLPKEIVTTLPCQKIQNIHTCLHHSKHLKIECLAKLWKIHQNIVKSPLFFMF